MHAPSAMNVCVKRKRKGEGELSVHTMHTHSGKAYRFREMDSVSGNHTYQTFRVWHLVSWPDLTLTPLHWDQNRITSADCVLHLTCDSERASERSIN